MSKLSLRADEEGLPLKKDLDHVWRIPAHSRYATEQTKSRGHISTNYGTHHRSWPRPTAVVLVASSATWYRMWPSRQSPERYVRTAREGAASTQTGIKDAPDNSLRQFGSGLYFLLAATFQHMLHLPIIWGLIPYSILSALS